MVHVKMYYSDNCPFCSNAEKLLLSKGVDIEKIDIEAEPEDFSAVVKEINQDSVPQWVINNRMVLASK